MSQVSMKNIGLLCLLGWAHSVFSDTVSDALQAKLHSIHAMSAQFTQIVKTRHRALSRSSGTMALARPGRFRWQTVSPMAQLVVANGKTLWIYDADLEQVSVKKQAKEMSGTAAVFLSADHDTIDRDFVVSVSEKGSEAVFDMRAKSHKESIQQVKLRFVGDLLTGIELFDQLGQDTLIHLNHIKTNIPLSASLFQFKIPKGVDVVEQ